MEVYMHMLVTYLQVHVTSQYSYHYLIESALANMQKSIVPRFEVLEACPQFSPTMIRNGSYSSENADHFHRNGPVRSSYSNCY